ncbi:RNA-directed DNA polymerase, eukaryota [Tanacetum coccineum]|uniref:RNA-directed DNA polymerase, eukaryota n=1 Tax=Tanacetum coccineum TaxID=301880 RepID=A0ABQ5ESI5_9ASTR
MAAVSDFFSLGEFSSGCNSSFIALIPKFHDAKVVSDFRPISLIGSLYKIITKILANRLTLVISDLISDVQSAFVTSRQILDGPFILNELLSWCKHKKLKAMFFKVNFEKAFDSIKWDYLDDVLMMFWFGNKWWCWIRGCLKSARGSVLVNGSPTSEFQFHKGLKQGDPLPPFLFILDMSNFITIVNVLRCFHMASGLKLNIHKSKIMGVGVRAEETLRLSKWKLNNLSIGGRLTLIKCVLSSILLYHMSIFRVPMGVLHSMESIRRNFFNGTDGSKRKLAMISWNKALASKKYGGLSISSFFAFNRAFLFKWIWRFFSQGSSLWARFIKAIYGKRGAIDSFESIARRSHWLNIVRETKALKNKDDMALKHRYPRLYALESSKQNYEASDEFSVKLVRSLIDYSLLPKEDLPTR